MKQDWKNNIFVTKSEIDMCTTCGGNKPKVSPLKDVTPKFGGHKQTGRLLSNIVNRTAMPAAPKKSPLKKTRKP